MVAERGRDRAQNATGERERSRGGRRLDGSTRKPSVSGSRSGGSEQRERTCHIGGNLHGGSQRRTVLKERVVGGLG